MEQQLEIILFGQVQRVGMRFFIRALAQKYSLVGCVCNLSDGTVKVIVIGKEERLDLFLEDIVHNGPGNIEKIEKHFDNKKYNFTTFSID